LPTCAPASRPPEAAFSKRRWCVFSVRCDADDCQALEQLCRYITRPALANERVQTNAAGQVVLKLSKNEIDASMDE